MSQHWKKNKIYLGNIITHPLLDILILKRHYEKYQNITYGLDSNNLSLTILKTIKTAKDIRSINIL